MTLMDFKVTREGYQFEFEDVCGRETWILVFILIFIPRMLTFGSVNDAPNSRLENSDYLILIREVR